MASGMPFTIGQMAEVLARAAGADENAEHPPVPAHAALDPDVRVVDAPRGAIVAAALAAAALFTGGIFIFSTYHWWWLALASSILAISDWLVVAAFMRGVRVPKRRSSMGALRSAPCSTCRAPGRS